ncbi:MAG: putative manganese-dependent inorganic diphosphatase [Cellulosilyticaceae bacterium]
MGKDIYVFGHKNPDTDSICSAIAYAHLKSVLGYDNVKAARLGKIGKEAKFALEYFQVKEPMLLESIKPQVSDMQYYVTPPIYQVDSVKKAWDVMTKSGRPMTPVLYPDHKLAGVVSVSDISKTYIGLTDGSVLREHKTPFVNIAAVLEGRIVSGDYPHPYVQGDVYTTASISENDKLNENDIILTGNNKELVEIALKSGAGCVIITDQDMEKLDVPKGTEEGCAIICTPYSFFKAIKMISQSISVKNLIGKQDLVYFDTSDTIDEVKETMLNSTHRHFPIINEEGLVKGIISKRHILDIKKKQVILVDHNEQTQSAPGIEQAEILEIIDHHRIANINTGVPVFLRAEPVGCTSTIVAKMYEENNIMPPREIAGVMLSAIISDTLLFKSPTCTPVDMRMAKRLAKIAEVDLEQYGMDLLAAGTSLEGVSAKELLGIDRKQFTLGKFNASVAQINTGDFKSIFKMKEEILAEMNELIEHESLDVILFMVTDIIVGGSELIAVGPEKWIADRAFDMQKDEESVFMKDVYSRKKQILPKLMSTVQNG